MPVLLSWAAWASYGPWPLSSRTELQLLYSLIWCWFLPLCLRMGQGTLSAQFSIHTETERGGWRLCEWASLRAGCLIFGLVSYCSRCLSGLALWTKFSCLGGYLQMQQFQRIGRWEVMPQADLGVGVSRLMKVSSFFHFVTYLFFLKKCGRYTSMICQLCPVALGNPL